MLRRLPAFVVTLSLTASVLHPDALLAADAADVKVKGKPASAPAIAASDAAGTTRKGVPLEWLKNTSMFNVNRSPERARSAFWFPLLSFTLPGFDQWWEGQWTPAIAYTGVAAAGYGYVDYLRHANGLYEDSRLRRAALDRGEDDPNVDDEDVDTKDTLLRKMALAGQIAQWSGGMSTYHSFRTAVRTRKQYGEYDFLKNEETPWDLMVAPFEFAYILRPTTFIPLAVIAGLSVLTLKQPLDDDSDVVKDKISGEDAFFAGAISYNAGTHEEAVFRGWLQPWLMQQWGSPFWSNATQSLVFGAAHLNTNPLPIVQILLGYHLGWVTQRNGYRLSEAIFIHAWWDVVALATSYNYKVKPKDDQANARLLRPIMWLPPLELAF